jgi:hypothetical protein
MGSLRVHNSKESYGATYGFAGSSQIVVETKSGGNTLHGKTRDHLRNYDFDTYNYFSINAPGLHQHLQVYSGDPIITPTLYGE